MESVTSKSVWRRSKMENNYQLSRIHNYINGLMSREEMFDLEKEALEDPFLQDAIDGYRLQKGVDARSLSLLQRRLERRVEQQASEKSRRYFSWQRLTIGMAAGVMFLTVCTLILIRYIPKRADTNVTEVELMDDKLMTISVIADQRFDGQPVEGWSRFEKYLASHYSGLNNKKEIQVSFDIDGAGKPYHISPSEEADLQISREIVTLLERGPLWKGTRAQVKIVFPE